MKLVLIRDRSKSFTGNTKFPVTAKIELIDEEKSNVNQHKMGDTLLYTNIDPP